MSGRFRPECLIGRYKWRKGRAPTILHSPPLPSNPRFGAHFFSTILHSLMPPMGPTISYRDIWCEMWNRIKERVLNVWIVFCLGLNLWSRSSEDSYGYVGIWVPITWPNVGWQYLWLGIKGALPLGLPSNKSLALTSFRYSPFQIWLDVKLRAVLPLWFRGHDFNLL